MVDSTGKFLVPFLFLLVGCRNLTECEVLFDAGINVYSPVNLEHEGAIEIDSSARCFVIVGNELFLGCTDGYARCYSKETLALLHELQVGLPSPSGYLDIEYSPYGSSLYLVGAAGTVLEIDLPLFSVIDEFSPCTTPAELEITQGDPGYLWVVDGSGNSVHQVHLETNGHCGSLSFSSHYIVSAVEASIFPDSLLVGTSDGFFRLESPSPGDLRSTWLKDVSKKCMALASIPGDSNFVTVLEISQYSKAIGELCAYDDSTYIFPPPRFYNSNAVTGEVVLLEPGSSGDYAYFLASGSSGNSILGAYRIGENYGVETMVEVPGNPLDLQVAEEGEVYVLTYM